MERDLTDHWKWIDGVRSKIEEVVGVWPEGTWYAGEAKWGTLRLGDVFDVPELGQVKVVDVHEELDDFPYWSQPIWLILQVGEDHFRVTGKNVSHEGNTWEYAKFEQVKGSEQTRTVWSGTKR